MGFPIDREWQNPTLIDVSAPSALVSRTFGAGLAPATIDGRARYVATGAIFATHGHGSAFRDIVTGRDGYFGAAGVCAHAGFDPATGLGLVDVYRPGLLMH